MLFQRHPSCNGIDIRRLPNLVARSFCGHSSLEGVHDEHGNYSIEKLLGWAVRSGRIHHIGLAHYQIRFVLTDTPFGAKDCARIHPRSHGQKEAPKIRINRDFYRIITQHKRAHPSS